MRGGSLLSDQRRLESRPRSPLNTRRTSPRWVCAPSAANSGVIKVIRVLISHFLFFCASRGFSSCFWTRSFSSLCALQTGHYASPSDRLVKEVWRGRLRPQWRRGRVEVL
eukprot:scaffold5222_cov293-Pinguiococcus_pyrenoidosus.AAC.3